MNNLVKVINSRQLAGAVRLAVKNQGACSLWVRPMGGYGGHGHDKPYRPSMLDDLPVPQGSWQAAYDKAQTKHNLQLIVGGSFFLFTVWFVFRSGYLFFNFYPPELPEDGLPE